MMSSINNMKFVFIALLLAAFTQYLTTGTPMLEMVDSVLVMAGLMFVSMVAKEYIKSPLPTFAYATIIGIAICLPETAFRDYMLTSVGKISFLSCCVPLLTFAGLSVGGRIEELKKLSWKIIVLFLVVATSCFFGASMVAQIGFTMLGII